MKKDKSAAAKAVKLSEAELLERLARSEKHEIKLKHLGADGIIIGVIGLIIFTVVDIEPLAMIFFAMLIGGGICCYLGVRSRRKAESLVNAQLNDFFEAELERAFGPRMRTSKMRINEPFLQEIRPVEQRWNKCQVWRFYEGDYHGIHFSAANVWLYELDNDPESLSDTRKTKFEGVVLRCKDICDPALDIALRGPGADHRQSDLMDPAVFRQDFSARTADDQPADDLVTPQLRELIQKLESLANNYTVIELIFRDGEAILAITGYTFAEGLPSGDGRLRDLDLIRSRFTASLTPVGNLIDILRENIALFAEQIEKKEKGRICYETDHCYSDCSFGHCLLVHQNGQWLQEKRNPCAGGTFRRRGSADQALRYAHQNAGHRQRLHGA